MTFPDHRTLILAVKPAVAGAGAMVLAWEWWAARRPDPFQRLRTRVLTLLALVAFACWWNLGAFHFANRYVHTPELFHYFLGAKYFDELGYTRLYDCAAVVEAEHGRGSDVARRWIRDLTNNEVRRGSPVLADPQLCRSHFSPERWTSFTADVLWFHDHMTPEKWRDVLMDHGYNGSPVWRLAAAPLARGPATELSLRTLALIDPVLIVIMWSIVWWAFGWRVTCVALLWWGTNAPAGFTYIGGAFLRADWLLLTVAAIACAYRQRPFAAGVALGWAALLRIFPVLLVVGVIITACRNLAIAKTERIRQFHVRFAAGMIAAALTLVALTALAAGSVDRAEEEWLAFVANTTKHVGSRGANHLGLQAALSFAPDNRSVTLADYWLDTPWDTWALARRSTLESRRPLMWSLIAAFVLLFVAAVWRQPDWAALTLGTTLIPMLLDLSNYYYGFLLVLAFLWRKRPAIGVALCVASVVSNIALAVSPAEDDRAMITNVAVLAVVWLTTVLFALDRRESSSTDTSNTSSPDAYSTVIAR